MDDLVPWLREQIGNLRKAALTALRGYPYPTPAPSKHDTDHWHSHWDALYQAPGRDNYVGGRQIADFPQSPYAAAFAARFDPAAALAQCDAHEAILDECVHIRESHVSDDFTADNLAETVIRQLGLAYQHRPGFREEWRPDVR